MPDDLSVTVRRPDGRPISTASHVKEFVQLTATAQRLRTFLTTEALDKIPAPGNTTVFILQAIPEERCGGAPADTDEALRTAQHG